MSHVLERLSKLTEPDEPNKSLRQLAQKAIFPIMNPKSSCKAGYDHLAAGKTTGEWFIADRAHLETSFRGVVPLLAFSLDKNLGMQNIFRALGFEDRCLSKAVKGVAVTENPVEFHPKYTGVLRTKTDFFIR
jgi:hypothetical protein